MGKYVLDKNTKDLEKFKPGVWTGLPENKALNFQKKKDNWTGNV